MTDQTPPDPYAAPGTPGYVPPPQGPVHPEAPAYPQAPYPYGPQAPAYPQAPSPYAVGPGPYGPGLYGQPQRTGANGFAIAGFVLSFMGGCLGLIFSIIGLVESKK